MHYGLVPLGTPLGEWKKMKKNALLLPMYFSVV
jgi:hypothetical protein